MGKLLSDVQLFAIPWTVAHQAPLLMEKAFPGLVNPSSKYFIL